MKYGTALIKDVVTNKAELDCGWELPLETV